MHFLPQRHVSEINRAHLATGAGVLLALTLTWGCKSDTKSPADKSVPKVVCAAAAVMKITDYDEFVGRTEAAESVEVRSRLSGFLRTVEFEEGGLVKKGDLLATIQPDEFEAIHNQSVARIALWESKLNLARSKLRRSESLIKTAAISQEELDESIAGVKEAEAALVAAKADAARTALDLEYTKIVSPIAGRIDRAQVTPGNMLTGGLGSGTLLTRIVSVAPVFAYVDVDEATILSYIRKVRAASGAAGEQDRAALRDLKVPCYLQLNDEAEAGHLGVLDFVENRVDKSTGTIRLRGVFPNEDRILLGGMFVRVKVPVSEAYDATLIPETAIGTDQSFKFAYVVNDNSKTERRTLTLGAMRGSLRIVREGIQPGERVIIRGIQRVRPDMEVAAELEKLELSPPASPSAAAATEGAAQ